LQLGLLVELLIRANNRLHFMARKLPATFQFMTAQIVTKPVPPKRSKLPPLYPSDSWLRNTK
jgi:hypothetical protein